MFEARPLLSTRSWEEDERTNSMCQIFLSHLTHCWDDAGILQQQQHSPGMHETSSFAAHFLSKLQNRLWDLQEFNMSPQQKP